MAETNELAAAALVGILTWESVTSERLFSEYGLDMSDDPEDAVYWILPSYGERTLVVSLSSTGLRVDSNTFGIEECEWEYWSIGRLSYLNPYAIEDRFFTGRKLPAANADGWVVDSAKGTC